MRPYEHAASHEGPATESGPPLPFPPRVVDEAALTARNQSTNLGKGKGRASVTNDFSVEAAPSGSDASTTKGKLAAKGDSTKIHREKGKAVAFSESYVAGSASGSIASKVQEDNATSVDHRGTGPGSPPFYASDSGCVSTTSGVSGEKDEGETGVDTLEDSTSA
ncbi:hypothetical protein E8E12_006178 [Didymella heteroderae]|uniref:Uncharacterized protein n=1 Tax=Didymella heteroderae TaxID=1769908 RepID=A0A9P5C2Z7_9PLEO|nr:hypothetical protein E8E12_006178 [Didymella heteroderae]